MTCDYCGNTIPPNAPNCPSCGAAVSYSPETIGRSGNPALTRTLSCFWGLALAFASLHLLFTLLEFGSLASSGYYDNCREIASYWVFIRIFPAIPFLLFGSLLHYGCWRYLQNRQTIVSPGEAVGFLFVPFYNLYWAFPSFSGLGREYRKLAEGIGLINAKSLSNLGRNIAVLFVLKTILWTISISIIMFDGDEDALTSFSFFELCSETALLVTGLRFYRKILQTAAVS